MSGFDYLSLIKRQAKARAKTESIKLSAAQKSIAFEGGFAHYHELQKVASKNPDDIRLMRLALQTADLKEVVYGEGLYEQIDHILEDELSTYMAETNADGFCIDQLTVDKVAYDQKSGVLSILADIIYSGDQKPDRPFSGNTFYVHVIICLFRQVDHWELHIDNDKRLQILEVESDQDRDWQEQRHGIDSLKNLSALASTIEAAQANLPDYSSLTGAIEASELFKEQNALASTIEAAQANLPDYASLTGAIETTELFKEQETLASTIEAARTILPDYAAITSATDMLRKKGLI